MTIRCASCRVLQRVANPVGDVNRGCRPQATESSIRTRYGLQNYLMDEPSTWLTIEGGIELCPGNAKRLKARVLLNQPVVR